MATRSAKSRSDVKRRVGLGFLGIGSTLVMLGIRYDSDEGREFARQVSEVLRDTAYLASAELAKEKGAFPLFDSQKYLSGQFAQRLPKAVRKAIEKMVCAILTCCRLHQPAPSHWHSQTMHRTVSNPRFHGSITVKSAWPLATRVFMKSPITPGVYTARWDTMFPTTANCRISLSPR
jgi:ribonucleotide reductase alpha subunit